MFSKVQTSIELISNILHPSHYRLNCRYCKFKEAHYHCFKYFDRIVSNFAGKSAVEQAAKCFVCLSLMQILCCLPSQQNICKLLSWIGSISASSLSHLLIENIDKLHKKIPVLIPFFFFQICIKVRSELMGIWHSGKFRESTCTQRPCSKVAKHRRELTHSQFEKKPTKLTFVKLNCKTSLSGLI